MKVLIDTNILIDVAAGREKLCESSEAILGLCAGGIIQGFVSSRAFCDMFYILRKSLSVEERKRQIRSIRGYLETVIISNSVIDAALANDDITDFEDAIQHACAQAVDAEYIVTRNTKDYAKASIRAITPEELLIQFQ